MRTAIGDRANNHSTQQNSWLHDQFPRSPKVLHVRQAFTAFCGKFYKLSACKDGGRDRDRTCDPHDVNVVLSR